MNGQTSRLTKPIQQALMPGVWVWVMLLLFAWPAQGGIYYSGERFAELPSEWRGFASDLRLLRSIAVPTTPTQPASTLKLQYQDALKKLEDVKKQRSLSADEQADVGALLIRLGQLDAALAQLQQAQREHPRHFAIAANLATAWYLTGDLRLAIEYNRLSAELAPNAKHKELETWQLQLFKDRLKKPRQDTSLDQLFHVAWTDAQGRYLMGRLSAADRQKLPDNALAIVQQLLLWYPADGRLIWQMGEIAAAYGDVRGAADLLDMAVGEFAINHADLRQHRQILLNEANARANQPLMGAADMKAKHAQHGTGIAFRSKRPLVMQRLDYKALAPINPKGMNEIPWALLMETVLDRHFKPTFPEHLKRLNGLQVEMIGYLQPITDDVEAGVFLLVEFPAGCWFCEMPDPTGIVLIELPADKTAALTRDAVKVQGTLLVNSTDPENFLFTIQKATISPPS